jgi:hypothetical protein
MLMIMCYQTWWSCLSQTGHGCLQYLIWLCESIFFNHSHYMNFSLCHYCLLSLASSYFGVIYSISSTCSLISLSIAFIKYPSPTCLLIYPNHSSLSLKFTLQYFSSIDSILHCSHFLVEFHTIGQVLLLSICDSYCYYSCQARIIRKHIETDQECRLDLQQKHRYALE